MQIQYIMFLIHNILGFYFYGCSNTFIELLKIDVIIDVTQDKTKKPVKSRVSGFEVGVLQQKYNKFTTHNTQ